jgi:cellulose 1,4-beta-cellobiosidase
MSSSERAARLGRVGTGVILALACSSAPKPPPSPPAPPPAPAQKAPPFASLPVAAASGPAAPQQNPFAGAEFFVNPDYGKKVTASMQAAPPALAKKMAKLQRMSTSLWLESIGALSALPAWLDGAAAQQKKAKKPVVPIVVVYDLPNRDCSSKSSAGELDIEKEGEARYRSEFIDPIAKQFAARPDQRVVVVLEPDSLPNVATNLDVEKCRRSADVYESAVAYAIATLSLPNVYIYVDAAHAGWLGWDGNRDGAVKVFKRVLDKAGGPDRIRGFISNVSNYNALEGDWGKKLEPSTPCPNELTYIEKLAQSLSGAGIANKGFLIDTSRNGVPDARTRWGSWCNVKNAGLGERPQVAPRPLIDAYVWIKPPGESDGVSDPNAPRFDESCRSPDSAPDAPQAGQWFDSYFRDLVAKANPAL